MLQSSLVYLNIGALLHIAQANGRFTQQNGREAGGRSFYTHQNGTRDTLSEVFYHKVSAAAILPYPPAHHMFFRL